MIPDLTLLTSVASRHGIPPAILYGVGMQSSGFNDAALNSTTPNPDGTIGVFGISLADLSTYGFTAAEVAGNVTLQAEIAARKLSQDYQSTGSWDQTLSLYNTGNASAGSSPTDPAGGWIAGVMAQAAQNPTLGLNTMNMDAQSAHFAPMLTDFGNHLAQMAQSGGIVTNSTIAAYQRASSPFITGHDPIGSTIGGTKITADLQAAAKNNQQSYTAGQCTAYVAASLGFIPAGLGNAEDWAARASAKGFNVTHQPAVGTAVVYGPGGGYSTDAGHVAVVTSVNADGTFMVSEMNYDGAYVADTRHSTMNDVIGFINAPPGTDMSTAAPGLKTDLQQAAQTQQLPSQKAQQPTPPKQPKDPNAQRPDPLVVEKFFTHARALGLDANHIIDNAETFANLSRYYGLPANSLEAFAKTKGMSAPEIAQWLTAQPLPAYPGVQAGHFKQVYDSATIHSLLYADRMPQPAEVARLAQGKAGDPQIAAYYGALKRKSNEQQDTGTQGQQQQQQPGQATSQQAIANKLSNQR